MDEYKTYRENQSIDNDPLVYLSDDNKTTACNEGIEVI